MTSNDRRSKSIYAALDGLLLLLCVLAVIMSQRAFSPRALNEPEHEGRMYAKTSDPEPLAHRTTYRNRKSWEEMNRNSPLATLSPRLRVIVRDLETRSAFMDSPFGFTNEEQSEAMEKCQGIVESLDAEEVGALIRFYRSPEARKLPLKGNELVGAMLYKQWGKVDGEEARRAVESWIIDDVSMINGEVDLTDPFQINPNFYEVGRMISGWTTIDREASQIGLQRLLSELGRKGISTINFKAAILESFPELLQKTPKN